MDILTLILLSKTGDYWNVCITINFLHPHLSLHKETDAKNILGIYYWHFCFDNTTKGTNAENNCKERPIVSVLLLPRLFI